jgi:polyisoprenoid-binding protein YceI
VLQSAQDAYQYITFEPTAIEGLPATVQPGDTFTFNVTGNLKIRDAVNPATFDVEVTADSATQISGLAQTTIALADYALSIPDVPFVADVSEDVGLELQFVAAAQ